MQVVQTEDRFVGGVHGQSEYSHIHFDDDGYAYKQIVRGIHIKLNAEECTDYCTEEVQQ